MRKLVTVMAASMLLAGCGGDSGTIETEDGEELVINSNVDTDAAMPEGYSLYPGAEIVQNMTMRQNDGEISSFVLNSSASPEELTAFYRRQAEAAGIEISMEMTTGDTRMISGTDDAGRMFNFTASPGGDGTTANLSVGRDRD